jgi:hypothetical protein
MNWKDIVSEAILSVFFMAGLATLVWFMFLF